MFQVDDEFNILTYVTSSLFIVSSFLYMSVSVAFSRGKPFRTSIFKNYFFIGSLLLLIGFNTFLLFAPTSVADFMMIRIIPGTEFKLILLGVAGGHFITCVFFEMAVVEQSALWGAVRSIFARFRSNNASKRYKVIRQQLESTCDVTINHMTEKDQSVVVNPISVLNKPLHSKVMTNHEHSTKTRL